MPQDKSCLSAKHPFQCPCWRVGPDSKHFHLVKTLSESGIALYLTGIQHEHNQESSSKIDYAMVIDNNKSYDFLTLNVIQELAKFKTRCPRCLNVIERVQAIINYYDCIKKKDILAICPDCSAMRRKKLSCVQCDDLTQKFRVWKRKYLEGISVPGDSKLWLNQIDKALHDMKEPYNTQKRTFTEKDMKRPSHEMEVILKSTPSKALSYTGLGETQKLLINKIKDVQEQVKEFNANAYDNLGPMYTTSADGKHLLREKADDPYAISINAVKKKVKEMAKDRYKDAMDISKSGQVLRKETKKPHHQVTSPSDSDTFDVDEKKKSPKMKKKTSSKLKNMKSTDLDPQSSIDLELVKQRKLRKHHSLDTFLTSIDKKEKKAKKNFTYLFPEELKRKSKSTDNLKIKEKRKMQIEKGGVQDQSLNEDINRDSQKQKNKYDKIDTTKYRSKSKSSDNLKTGGKIKEKIKMQIDKGGVQDQSLNEDINPDSQKQKNKYDKKDTTKYRSKSKSSDNLKIGGKIKEKRKMQIDKGGVQDQSLNEDINRDSQKQKNKYDKIDTTKYRSNSELDDKDATGTKKSKAKEKQYGNQNEKRAKEKVESYGGKNKRNENDREIKQGNDDNDTYIDTDKKNKKFGQSGRQSGKKEQKLHETGESGKKMKPGSVLDLSLKPPKRGKDEKGSKLDNGVTGETKSSKRKDKYDSSPHEEEQSKYPPGAKVFKHGKGDNDFNSKQDHGAEIGKRRKDKVKSDGKEDKDRNQSKVNGDKRQKIINNKSKMMDSEKETRGNSESKRRDIDDPTEKAFSGPVPEKQKEKAEKTGVGDQSDAGKEKDSIRKNKKGDLDGSNEPGGKGKSKPQIAESQLLLKQIRAQRSALDNKIAGLVKVKEKVTKKQTNIPTDVTKLIKKKIPSKPLDSEDDLKFEEVLCDEQPESTHEFIVGEIITHVKPEPIEENNMGLKTLLFNTKIDDDKVEKIDDTKIDPESPIVEKDETAGITHYALSDRQFIDMGWTMLPTEKVVRKMNVYRMRPAHPEFDWFERNKNKQNLFYDSGEKMAEFDRDGHVKWFYRNGRLALDYYEAEEVNAQQRFVIYGNGEADQRGRPRPVTVLAMFDYLGNGVVLDNAGKIRLKYNQTEGVIMDKSLGPVSHWKWHTLNDPPVLQQVMIDTHLSHKDPEILQMGGKNENAPRSDNEDMLAIEFDNFIKEKSKKLAQTFKPYQIKMKALKINEYFSLRVLDQASVYLIYRDGTTNIKLNIGMLLDHKEIVDTDTAELGDVSNNIERFPARTISLEGIQRNVAHAQHVEAARVGVERRLRPPVPVASVDRLVAAISKPLRSHLRTVPTTAANYRQYEADNDNSNTCPNL